MATLQAFIRGCSECCDARAGQVRQKGVTGPAGLSGFRVYALKPNYGFSPKRPEAELCLTADCAPLPDPPRQQQHRAPQKQAVHTDGNAGGLPSRVQLRRLPRLRRIG